MDLGSWFSQSSVDAPDHSVRVSQFQFWVPVLGWLIKVARCKAIQLGPGCLTQLSSQWINVVCCWFLPSNMSAQSSICQQQSTGEEGTTRCVHSIIRLKQTCHTNLFPNTDLLHVKFSACSSCRNILMYPIEGIVTSKQAALT